LTHLWKPLLHEVAAGTLNPHQQETNYFAHSAAHHYEFVLGTFTSLDREAKQIIVETEYFSKKSEPKKNQRIGYDTLVLALGSTSNDFTTEGVKQLCHFLDSRQQAAIFQQDLLHLYLNAQHETSSRELNIAIIGAGATGVELAAELVEAKQNFFQYGLNKVDPNKVKINLIEAADRILTAVSANVAPNV